VRDDPLERNVTIPSDATVDQRAAWLRESGIWATLSASALDTVAAAMQPAGYASGQFIIRQGEPGRHLHVLIGGEAEVRIHAPGGAVITVATMSAGACFGEMSLLSGDVTSADVIARTDCETLALDRPTFEALVAGEPQLLREFVRMVSRRLRESNVAMGAAREKEKGLTRFLQEARTEQYGELVGTAPAMRTLQRQIDAQAGLDGPVLIQGERGTGKELVARLIHFRSARKDAPLLSTDCAQIAETPWGDKLFGDYRPAPEGTGPPPPVSYLDLAEGGTIVLKDLDALPRAIQDRLAAYLARESGTAGPGRVRIIATCRENLDDLATAGTVSPALVRAVAAQRLVIPPLRQRKRDIAALAAHFVRKHALRLGKAAPGLDDEALNKLVTHEYLAANVTELEDGIRRAVILTDGPRIESEAIFLGQPPPPSRWAFNLLTLPQPAVGRALRLFPRALQALAAVIFGFIFYECWFAPAGPDGNWGTLLVWSVWWPLLVLSFFFAGRAWCAVCPMMSAGGATQRLFNLGWHIPAWLKRHDATIVMAGFFLIVWAEEATRMRHSPRATGALLLAIVAGAVVTAALLPRRTWCRHLCPLGGLAGVGAMTGLVELRPTPDICAAKCRDHACFKGDGHAGGCPMFNHVMFVDSNQHCVLCLQCVGLCAHHSPQLNVRLPALDLLTTTVDRSHVGRLMALLAGLLVALSAVQLWERQAGGSLPDLLGASRLLVVTAVLALGALLPQLGLWLLTRRFDRSADSGAEIRFWQRVTAWVPVVTAGFVCYELAFIPGFDAVRVTLGTDALGGGAGRGLSVALLSVVQGGILCAGLIVTLIVLFNLRQEAADRERRPWWRDHGPGIAAGAAYWTALAVLILR
jgi:transcriptional regulator with AAA-type ATPase domain